MKVSRSWLQKFFTDPLPEVDTLADTLTFHSSEVEEVAGEMLDVKVLPDRACYALSHRGIAYELSAALDLLLTDDPFDMEAPTYPETSEVAVTVCDEACVPRFSAALVRGVKVGPSPTWLREALESVGQRSINNIVDATNYVMLNLGQPLHAFDAGKLTFKDGAYSLLVRAAYEGEEITTLTGETYVLPEGALLVVDGHTDTPVGIAGVKGGKSAEVTSDTIDLVIEAANFNPSKVRRASQALKLFTDASLRFQNRLSPDLVPYGMHSALSLITEVAGGEVVGVTDKVAARTAPSVLSVTLSRVNDVLGTAFTKEEVADALTRLKLSFEEVNDVFSITVPFVRRDLTIPEDIAEEVGRILGYDRVPVTPLPPVQVEVNQRRYRGIERIKDALLERGYVEVFTPSFASEGEIRLANPLQTDRPYLRASLTSNMEDALVRAKREAPRVLGPEESLKLFEIGNVFRNDGEHLSLALGYEALTGKPSASVLDQDLDAVLELVPGLPKPAHEGRVAELMLDTPLEAEYVPRSIRLGAYQPFSPYPFALRDIAVWTPSGTEESEVALLIQKEAGDLLVRMDRFDTFEKDGRVSYAFRLVFQSHERTLADTDLDPIMARMTDTLNARDGWEVR